MSRNDRASCWLPTPLGPMFAAADRHGLSELRFAGEPDAPERPMAGDGAVDPDRHPLLARLRLQLAQYFAGQRHEFAIELAPDGTPFQLRAWRALQAIPYGATRSYTDQARMIGQPAATRAVGAANARNPIAIVVPCHRVLGSDGRLVGFAAGLERKRALLALESAPVRRAGCA